MKSPSFSLYLHKKNKQSFSKIVEILPKNQFFEAKTVNFEQRRQKTVSTLIFSSSNQQNLEIYSFNTNLHETIQQN